MAHAIALIFFFYFLYEVTNDKQWEKTLSPSVKHARSF